SARARRWLAPEWSALADRAAALPFAAGAGETHCAALQLEAGDWQAAQAAVATIESWRRIPQPLAWMAQARWRGGNPDSAWPLLVELAWIAPARFAALAPRLDDAALARLLRAFESDEAVFDDAGSWAWFPAWALAEQPLLAGPMAGAEPARQDEPERGWQLVNALLRVERRAEHAERVRLRAELQRLHEGLYATYMKPRR
ncbi:MAG: hypothetical protein KGM91_24775, partial [Burkholderiales bacterium]|nr:hypothetical protein [Burkholderiales bacterium]